MSDTRNTLRRGRVRRLLEDNPNTKLYWNFKYQSEPEYPNEADKFKFQNIAHHIKDNSVVLDLGCGNGYLCQIIAQERKQCDITGLDYSDKQIKELQGKDDSIKWICGEATKTELTYNSYDYVTCCETLEHVDDPDSLIKEAYRLLKDGGKLILTTPFRNHIPSVEHVWEFEYEDIQDMMDKYFDNAWAFPWASGWSEVITEKNEVFYHRGHFDTIMALGVK